MLSVGQSIGLAAGALVLCYIGRAVYRLFFHPLAHFPGPKWAAFSDVWFGWTWVGGTWPWTLAAMHKKYGDVVRIAPNELSFASVEAYHDIYGHATKSRKPFLKDTFYDMAESHTNLVTERDVAEHAKQRRMFSSAFSAKSLRTQEDVVRKYVDAFIVQVGKQGAPGGPGINLTEAFNWVTFDAIGDLAFGEPFGCTAEGKTHFWVNLLLDSQFILSVQWLRLRLPILNLLLPLFIAKDADKKLELHNTMSIEKARKRIALGENGRQDFFSHVLSKGGDKITDDELVSQAATLISAGSDTTASALSGIMWLLLSDRRGALARLTAEVRAEPSFAPTAGSGEGPNITGDACARLPFLNAVINEGLRLFSPAAFGLPRESPGAHVAGYYVPAGTTVRVEMWTTQRDPRHWREPEAFRPERWLEGEWLGGDNHDAFHPFSLGPRACIGINLAYLEMRHILATLLWTYDLEWVNTDMDFFKTVKWRFLWNRPRVAARAHPRQDMEAVMAEKGDGMVAC